ncbi:NAD(P)-dependent oxidoreductase [Metabacillus sp. RGM 3146]|uniref:NAD(P)-dependent oxidoreductase n=1 Tax=Metabacillus sp. RGM 3146 TaxID=3401092 RepID=UPI003B999C5C
MEKIAFIGTGVMGKNMALHLLKAGHEVVVYTRTKEKAVPLINEGAKWAETLGEAASFADVVITMIGYPQDVKEVYLEENGILDHARPDTIVIDMTTSSPSLAREIHKAASEKRIYSLDAPVSGGDIGAREARLAIMVGGDKEAFDKALSVFERMGSNVVYQGEAGAGQHTKMCNQITIASNMVGVCEAIAYAEASGLNPETVLKSISAGAAGSWSLSNLAPRILDENFEPGFYVKHFIKDMGIALEEAEAIQLKLPGLELAKKLYEELKDAGEENSGTHALYKLWKN